LIDDRQTGFPEFSFRPGNTCRGERLDSFVHLLSVCHPQAVEFPSGASFDQVMNENSEYPIFETCDEMSKTEIVFETVQLCELGESRTLVGFESEMTESDSKFLLEDIKKCIV
jgi:hypothetical protein